MLLYIELKFLVLLFIVLLVFFAIAFWVICFIIKRGKKTHIMMVRDKYTPMLGKVYLYVDPKSGIILQDKTGDKCMFFDNEEEAQFILDQYEAQKDKPLGTDLATFY